MLIKKHSSYIFIYICSASANAQHVSYKSSDWVESGSSFNAQLKDLNDHNENSIEWTRVGEFIKSKEN